MTEQQLNDADEFRITRWQLQQIAKYANLERIVWAVLNKPVVSGPAPQSDMLDAIMLDLEFLPTSIDSKENVFVLLKHVQETIDEKNRTPKPTDQYKQWGTLMQTHDKRMKIRKAIHKAGHNFFESFNDLPTLQNIAGEIQALNEDWAMNHEGTFGYEQLMRTGFSHNQAKWLTAISETLRKGHDRK